ncbi:MAG: YicC/YloC family endoribonuclease [Planctomycetota bacterium]
MTIATGPDSDSSSPTSTATLRSMTGQGRGESSSESGGCICEIRSVNHRGLKITIRLSDRLSSLESKIERLVRKRLRRGSVSVNVHWSSIGSEVAESMNVSALTEVASRLAKVAQSNGLEAQIDMATLLTLPGMIASTPTSKHAEAIWPIAEASICEALDRFQTMRSEEAETMALALNSDLAQIESRLNRISSLAPRVLTRYQDRLTAKIAATMQQHQLPESPIDVLREVQVFADRGDISEEITRLGSHIQMFGRVLRGEGESGAVGRKLDFIIQEMFRETNTIGSKAGDSDIAAEVVEIKCAIERMRELVQNLE